MSGSISYQVGFMHASKILKYGTKELGLNEKKNNFHILNEVHKHHKWNERDSQTSQKFLTKVMCLFMMIFRFLILVSVFHEHKANHRANTKTDVFHRIYKNQ